MTIADQLTTAGKTWKAYRRTSGTRRRSRRRAGTRRSARRTRRWLPTKTDMYATRHDPFVYFHSIIDTPACTTNVVGLAPLADRSQVGGEHAEPRVHHAERLRRRSRRTVQGQATRRLGLGRQVPVEVGAEDPRVAGVQGGRDARDHLRRGRDHGQARGRDRVLPHAGVAERAEARADRSRRRQGGCAHPVDAHEGRHRTPSPTTTTRCCAAWRTSSA